MTAVGLVAAAFILVGTEVLALGVFGQKAWAAVYFTPPAADALQVQAQAGQFANSCTWTTPPMRCCI